MDDLTRPTLLVARTLLSDRRCWTQGVLARDRQGRPVSALDPTAVSWCALGAVYRIADGDIAMFRRASAALEAVARALYGVGIRTLNDAPSPFAYRAVLGAFDHAIDRPLEARSGPPDLLGGRGLTGAPAGRGQARPRPRARRGPPRGRTARGQRRASRADGRDGR